MKAEDLMIGDWIGWLPSWKNEETGEIERDGDIDYPIIGKVGMLMKDCTTIDYCDESVEVEDIGLIPIPITPEILEKNGWMKVEEDGVFYPKQLKGELPWIGYATNEDGWKFRARDFCDIKYLHELQHALRLCGINKEIIL